MKWCWLLLGAALSLAGCSSDSNQTPGAAASPVAGSSGSTPATPPPAATSGMSAPPPARATGGAGAAGMAVSVAGRGSAGAPQAGMGQVAGGGAGAAGEARAGSGGRAGSAGASGSPAAGSGGAELAHFSFFVTSLAGLQKLSGKQEGFGGDLRHGQPNGLAGADKICSDLAETSMPGSAAKGWRAFLSVAQCPDGKPVNAIDRVGEGPWYDRIGRVVAMTKSALQSHR